MMANGLADTPARWPHDIPPDPVPDARLRPLGMMESLAGRRVRLAEAALARARHAQEQAVLALEKARQALENRVAFVAQERVRLRDECQASPDAGSALRRWREADQRLLDSIPPCRHAVTEREQALEVAEAALLQAQETHRQRTRRHEKFGMLIEQIVEEAA